LDFGPTRSPWRHAVVGVEQMQLSSRNNCMSRRAFITVIGSSAGQKQKKARVRSAES